VQLVQQGMYRLERAAAQLARSRRILLILLVVSFLTEAIAALRLARGAARLRVAVQKSHPQLAALHPSDPGIVSTLLLAEVVYASVYYSFGLLAVFYDSDWLPGAFACIALGGALVQPLLAPLAGQLSSILLFQRLAAYAHLGTFIQDATEAAMALRAAHRSTDSLLGPVAQRDRLSAASGWFGRPCPRRRRRRSSIHRTVSWNRPWR